MHTNSFRLISSCLFLRLFLLAIFLPLSIGAQDNSATTSSAKLLQFEHLSRENGLPSNSVTVIFQDSRGFMWFGTNEGLVRYDGYELKVYKNDPNDQQSLSYSGITAIYEDQDGLLWIGTELGLNRFDRRTETFKNYMHSAEDSLSVSYDYITTIYEDQQGLFWIGTSQGGLNLMDRGKETFLHYLPDPERKYGFRSNNISAIVEENAQPGVFWVGTVFNRDIRTQFNTATRTFNYFPILSQEGKPQSNHGVINTLFESKTSELWLGTTNGLDKVEPGNKVVTSYQEHPEDSTSLSGRNVTAIFEDARHDLWVSTRNGGLNQLPKGSRGFYHYRHRADDPRSLASDHVSAIFEDRSGVLWIGTLDAGISYADRNRQKFQHFKPYINHQKNLTYKYSVSSIYQDREQVVWIGSGFEGLLYYDEKANEFRHFQDESGELHLLNELSVWSILEDQQGIFWFATNRDGLYRFDRKKGSLKIYKNDPEDPNSLASNYVPNILESQNGTLWIATTEGLQQLDRETDRFQTITLTENGAINEAIMSLQEDQLGNLWVGSGSGLFCLNPEADVIRRFYYDQDDPNSLSDNSINVVAKDTVGNIWVGTKKGLNKISLYGTDQLAADTIRVIRYTEKDGLSGNRVTGILEDDQGKLWISTINGLSVFSNPQHNDKSLPDFKNFGLQDGLQSYRFHYGSFFKNPAGELFFGGVGGFNRFHPDSIPVNSFLPPIVITSFTSFDQDAPEQGAVSMKGISEKQELSLSYTNNIFSIRFAALNYRDGHKNKYAYQLEGFNERWIPLGTERQVTFTNLAPGTYTFRVKGANNDDIWNETPAELTITIIPPWWKTKWAYLLYVMIFLAALYLWRRYELNRRQLKYDQKIKQILADQELEQFKELDQFKSRFFTNITHEFRTPLTVILGTNEQLTDQSEQRATSSELPAIKGKHNLIKRNGENLLRLINQLLDLAKLESQTLKINYIQGDVLPYLRYISESLHSLAEAHNVTVRVESDELSIAMDYDPERLLQIIYNLLSNAIKFTPLDGRIVLRAGLKNSRDLSSLNLTVTDTGMGIPKEDLPYIFDRFYQANNLEKAKAGGTGIGLALTKELVGTLGGNISVESELGKGTTFTVILPITNKAVKSNGASWSRPVMKPESKLEGNLNIPAKLSATGEHSHQAIQPSNHLLIIEDNPDVVEYLTNCLQDSYVIDIAYNGRIGIEKALETIPDLIVSDVMMPEKDGFEVTDTLKNDERTSHIPIVLLTAKADIQSRLNGLRRGADAYLSKPFHQEELRVTLANLLELRKKLQNKFKNLELTKTQALSPKSQATDYENAFLKKVLSLLEKHLDTTNYSVPQLSQDLGLSQSQLYRKIKALTDLSTVAFIRRFRLIKGKQLLETTDLSISEVAYQVGFSTLSYFSDAFFKEYGLRPNAVRK